MMRIFPHSEDNEQAVLGSLLIDNDGYYKLDALKEEHFYYTKHQQIFSAVCSIIRLEHKADIITASTEMEREGLLESIGGIGYLAEICNHAPSSIHINQYAKQVTAKFASRQLIVLGQEIQSIGFKDKKDAILEVTKVKEMINDTINSSVEEKASDCTSLITTTMNHYIEKKERIASGKQIGLPTGQKFFEFEPKELIVISALPGVGKSILVTNIASHVSKYCPTMFFSFEMSNTEIMYRLLSMTNNVQLSKFKYGKYTKEEMERFITRYKHECPFLKIHDMTLTIDEIEIMCQKEKATNGLDLVVIDYAQITADEGELVPKTQYVTRKAKKIAQDLDCTVILVSQFNQKAESEKKFPERSQLLGGSSCVQNASQIWILHNPTLLESEVNDNKIDPLYILRKCKDRNASNCKENYILERHQDYMSFKQVHKTPSYCE